MYHKPSIIIFVPYALIIFFQSVPYALIIIIIKITGTLYIGKVYRAPGSQKYRKYRAPEKKFGMNIKARAV